MAPPRARAARVVQVRTKVSHVGLGVLEPFLPELAVLRLENPGLLRELHLLNCQYRQLLLEGHDGLIEWWVRGGRRARVVESSWTRLSNARVCRSAMLKVVLASIASHR